MFIPTICTNLKSVGFYIKEKFGKNVFINFLEVIKVTCTSFFTLRFNFKKSETIPHQVIIFKFEKCGTIVNLYMYHLYKFENPMSLNKEEIYESVFRSVETISKLF